MSEIFDKKCSEEIQRQPNLSRTVHNVFKYIHNYRYIRYTRILVCIKMKRRETHINIIYIILNGGVCYYAIIYLFYDNCYWYILWSRNSSMSEEHTYIF